MGSIPALPVVWSSLSTTVRAGGPTNIRRVRPSDPSWPAAASWERLKQQVGGHLIPVSSPLAPCTDAPGSAACVARVEEMKNPYFIGEQAGGTQTSGWLDGWTSAPSSYAVVARSTEEVVAAVNFARDNNLRLVVKGGGPPGLLGHEPDLAACHQEAVAITASANELRAIVPDAGAYVSESNIFDHTWQKSFWGPNYPRLMVVKKKYDPAGLFFVHHGVGSEEWSADGFTRLTGS